MSAMPEETQKNYDDFRGSISTDVFSTEPYQRKVNKPWGHEIHFTPDNLPYMGKLLHVDEGKRLSLQVHDVKRESWFLASGSMILIIEDANGDMQEIDMKPGQGYTCALGQKHRLKGGVGGGDVFEVSTPELGNTFRLEDDFSRDTETEEAREERNKKAAS